MNLHEVVQMVAAYLQSFLYKMKKDEGASAVEYGLVVSLIAVAIVVAVKGLGTKVSGIFTSITGSL